MTKSKSRDPGHSGSGWPIEFQLDFLNKGLVKVFGARTENKESVKVKTEEKVEAENNYEHFVQACGSLFS